MKSKKKYASKYQFREAKSGKLLKVEIVCGGGYGRPRCLRTRDLLKLMPYMGGGYGKPLEIKLKFKTPKVKKYQNHG